jgi:two-component system response regulator AtoC
MDPVSSPYAVIAEPGPPLGRVLVVDDEPSLRHLLRVILERYGYTVLEAGNGEDALKRVEEDSGITVVFCDIRMPKMDGMAFLEAVQWRPLRVVMMSAYGSTEIAVDAVARGAYDYIAKPFRNDEIRACMDRIVDLDRLERENRVLRRRVEDGEELAGFIGRDPLTHQVMEMVRRVAEFPSTVLITGQPGTGKGRLARALHALSPRSRARFILVNCAAIPENLLESELFGHERGACTGATRARAGRFEQASGGTLLLDEIGDMPLALQSRLLRVLEDGDIRRVGGNRNRQIDVRVIAATAIDLEEAVHMGYFRRDLFYRLNVVRIRVPTLQERPADIPLLAQTFLRRFVERRGRRAAEFSPAAMALLQAHPWPGNVRELADAIERAVLMCPGTVLGVEDLPEELHREAPGSNASYSETVELSIKRRTAVLEQELITQALNRTGGNRTQASRLLDISYKALLYKIKDYGIDP